MMPRRRSGGKAGDAQRRVTTSLRPATLLPALGLAAAALWCSPINAQSQGEAATFEGKPHRYTVSLPTGCRHETGPGTIDAICAPDFDAEKSAVARSASALLLAVAAESLEGAGDTGIATLLERYTAAGFREELPEAVCGEQDRARVKIENLSQSEEGTSLVYTADVVCAEIKFLQIGARRARVRHVIGPDAVYRLLARAPMDEFERQRGTIDAFFSSFRLAGIEKAEK
jgi:hypothetical protein